jgi:hypothetical protein
VYRGGRAGEIIDPVYLDVKRERYVVPDELETRLVEQIVKVSLRTGAEVVNRENLMAEVEEPTAEVRPDEPRPAGDKHPL